MICIECGAEADERAEGWRSYLTVDDEALCYCRACAEREFGTDPANSGESS